MKIEFDKEDVIELSEPFFNGCDFRLIFRPEGTTITFGCYLLINLMSGKVRIMHDLIEKEGKDFGLGYKELPLRDIMSVEESEYAKVEILKREPCGTCGAPKMVKRGIE